MTTREIAFKVFEAENGIKGSMHAVDDSANQDALFDKRPWRADGKYFKRVVISSQALIKMVTHAKSGGDIEVMGLMQGKIKEGAFFITDCFRLPVEGTETRVNAGESANEYMVEFTELNERTKYTNDFVCGWYHSHPGYGCWLSGIDVETQFLYQSHQDPFLAIVIDPHKTALTGKVEIGAFRTYPQGYSSDSSSPITTNIPAEKISDFGVHCNRYYSLEVEYHKSSLDCAIIDTIWSQYWAQSLSGLNYIQEECATSLKLALGQKKNIPEITNAVHKCACNRLHVVARDMLVERALWGRPSSLMDTSAS